MAEGEEDDRGSGTDGSEWKAGSEAIGKGKGEGWEGKRRPFALFWRPTGAEVTAKAGCGGGGSGAQERAEASDSTVKEEAGWRWQACCWSL